MATASEVFTPCLGCGESLILCDADWYTDTRPCCGCCTHLRDAPRPRPFHRTPYIDIDDADERDR